MTEQLFTLDEARKELALQQCREFGHNWSVVAPRTYADPCGTPIEVRCERCRQFHKVEPVLQPPAVAPVEEPTS